MSAPAARSAKPASPAPEASSSAAPPALLRSKARRLKGRIGITQAVSCTLRTTISCAGAVCRLYRLGNSRASVATQRDAVAIGVWRTECDDAPVEWVPDTLDPDNDQTREVYACAGLALYMAQVLEHGIANVVVLARAGGPEFRSPADYDALLDDLLSRTMGQQLRRALHEVDFTDDQIERLNEALRLRNFLAHDFFRERIDQFASVAGRNRLIEELDEIRDHFEGIDGEVQEIAYALWAKHGISRERVEAEVKRLMAASREAD